VKTNSVFAHISFRASASVTFPTTSSSTETSAAYTRRLSLASPSQQPSNAS